MFHDFAPLSFQNHKTLWNILASNLGCVPEFSPCQEPEKHLWTGLSALRISTKIPSQNAVFFYRNCITWIHGYMCDYHKYVSFWCPTMWQTCSYDNCFVNWVSVFLSQPGRWNRQGLNPTPWKFNTSPLKICNPKRKANVFQPFMPFRGELAVKLRGCSQTLVSSQKKLAKAARWFLERILESWIKVLGSTPLESCWYFRKSANQLRLVYFIPMIYMGVHTFLGGTKFLPLKVVLYKLLRTRVNWIP